MKKLKLIPLLICLLFTPACTLFKPFNSLLLLISQPSGHLKTSEASVLDGAWIRVKCTCAGKDTADPDQQLAHVIFINGNLMFQNQTGRWRNPKWNGYCLSHEEAILNQIADKDFEINSISHRTFSPNNESCEEAPDKTRIWKNLTVVNSELKFESTGGCTSGPVSCVFKRLEQ